MTRLPSPTDNDTPDLTNPSPPSFPISSNTGVVDIYAHNGAGGHCRLLKALVPPQRSRHTNVKLTCVRLGPRGRMLAVGNILGAVNVVLLDLGEGAAAGGGGRAQRMVHSHAHHQVRQCVHACVLVAKALLLPEWLGSIDQIDPSMTSHSNPPTPHKHHVAGGRPLPGVGRDRHAALLRLRRRHHRRDAPPPGHRQQHHDDDGAACPPRSESSVGAWGRERAEPSG